MKKAVLLSAVLLFAASAFGQAVPAGFDLANYGVRVEPDKRVMAVLATLEAARTTNDKGESVPVLRTPLSEEGEKFRELLNSDLAALNPELRQRITSFVLQHKRLHPSRSDAELVTPFISMAYALTPAPELADPIVTSDLPGALLDVLDFAPLVREFYRRSSFSANINEYIKTYQRAADGQLRNSAKEMVRELLGYLRTKPQLYFAEKIRTEAQKTGSKRTTLRQTETRDRERRFFIVPEMLAPTGVVQFMNVKDDYFVVLPPNTDLMFSDVRRAYLQFVIDPIVLENSRDIASISEGIKKLIAARSGTDTKVSPDVFLTVSRSLVAAIDAKQDENIKVRIATQQSREKIDRMKTVEEKKAVSADLEKFKREQADETMLRLSEDYEKGAILAFYFADQLKGVEDSGFDIASSMREMILSFVPAKENGRYEAYADARKRALAAREERKKNPTVAVIIDNPVTSRLVEIQKTINAKNYTQAASDLEGLRTSHPNDARVHYNLGRLASLAAEDLDDGAAVQAKLLEAKQAYENVIRIRMQQEADAAKGLQVKDPVDPALLSLTYVALAKIYEFNDEPSYALGVYDQAIKIGNVTGGAYNEAWNAKARLVKEQ